VSTPGVIPYHLLPEGSLSRRREDRAVPLTIQGKKPLREEVPQDRLLCEYCPSKCCRYFALPIEKPKEWSDFDSIRWYLAHQDVSVFVDDGAWYIMLHRDCNHLLPDGRCGIYDDRPQICRDYKIADCEYDDEYLYEKIFETDDQIWEYAEALLGPAHVTPRSVPGLSIVAS
jgi:Fe-S-cluster containining protein